MKQAFTLLLVVVAAAAQRGAITTVEEHGLEQPSSRDLLFGNFCDNFEIPQFGPIECSCKVQLFLPEVSAACFPPGRAPVCPLDIILDNLICGIPELKFGITLLSLFRLFQGQQPFFAGLCYTEVSIVGIGLPGFINEFCLDFANPQQPFTGPFSGLNNFLPFRSAVARSAIGQPYELCSATFNGAKCEVCEPCDDGSGGTGVQFSCLDGALVSDGCTTVASAPLPTDGSKSVDGLTFVAPVIQTST